MSKRILEPAFGVLPRKNKTSVQLTALDAVVNVNTLFTGVVFLGIAFNPTDTTETSSSCSAGPDVAKKIVLAEVLSFSFFLFSSLVAQGLKIHINLINSSDLGEPAMAMIDKGKLNFGVVASAVGSLLGCVFLMLSMVGVIQIRLGLLSCGSRYSVPAVCALVVLVASAVVIYIFNVGHGFLDQRRMSSASAKGTHDRAAT